MQVGGVLDDAARQEIGLLLRGATLHGRPDWVTRFTIAASRVVLPSGGPGLAGGSLAKEMAAPAGIGSSLGDLYADRSGTMFAKLATRDRATAEALQSRLVQGFRSDDFVPTADRPEEPPSGLEAPRGDGGSEGYRLLLLDIDRRIAACAGYREIRMAASSGKAAPGTRYPIGVIHDD